MLISKQIHMDLGRRERVRTALRHVEPDRVPVDFLATPEIWKQLVDHLEPDANVVGSAEYFEPAWEAVLRHFEVDCRVLAYDQFCKPPESILHKGARVDWWAALSRSTPNRMWRQITPEDPERSISPWRDTGVEVRGPAVADIEHAFAEVWSTLGHPLPEDELPDRNAIPTAGDVMLRVVASIPNTAGLYRLDQLIAVLARQSLWLTDAYFVGVAPYVQALRAAAMDGVDVRLLVPGTTDIPVLRGLSRSGYQPLL